MEIVLLELGQTIQVHERSQCIGEWCAIHRPMPGPWAQWPRWWREDRGIMERICACGIGHPVAEMYKWAYASNRIHLLMHDCCDCQCARQLEDDNTVILYLPADRVDPSMVEKLNRKLAPDLREELLDLVIALWPRDSHATVEVPPQLGKRLQRALLAAYDELEESQ